MKRIILSILIGIVLVIILALIIAPPVARRLVEKKAPDMLGRKIEVGALKVKYLGAKARIYDFTLYEADQEKIFVSFDTLMVDVKLRRLLRNELELQSFYLGGLDVNVVLEDSVLLLSDLAGEPAVETEEGVPEEEALKEDDPDKKGFRFDLSEIRLADAHISFENRDLQDTLMLNDVSFEIPYIGWRLKQHSQADLHFVGERTGSVEVMADLDQADGNFKVDLYIRDVQLVEFEKYVKNYAHIGSLEGLLNSYLAFSGNIHVPDELLVSGDLVVDSLSLKDPDKRRVLGLGSFRTYLGELDLAGRSFLVDSMVLLDPYAFLELKDSSNNISGMLATGTAEPESSDIPDTVSDSTMSGDSTDIHYALEKLRMEGGRVEIRDHSTGEIFEYLISDMTLRAEDVSSSSERVDAELSLVLNGDGTLRVDASFDPAHPAHFEADYLISDMDLRDLDVYSRYYIGRRVLYGDLHFKGNTRVKDHHLVSGNRLVLNKVELGEKHGGQTDLPVKTALNLLRDRNDMMDVDVPVEGMTNDPNLSVGQIITQAFTDIVKRVAYSPIDYLARTVGKDPGDVKQIRFEYLETGLSEKGRDALDLLLDLENKEDLKFELVYYCDREQEKSQMAALSVEEPGQRHEDLDVRVADLAEARRKEITDYLQAGNPSTGIKVMLSDPDADPNKNSKPRFELKYTVKVE